MSQRPEAGTGGVTLRVDGPLATVTLDRPPRNAQVPSTWLALADLPHRLPGDVRVLVVKARGPIFSAGLDLHLLHAGGVDGEPSAAELAADPRLDERIASFQSGFSWWVDHPAVSICRVSGPAVGAGFQLALATDLRVADTTASFAMKEVTVGLVPDLGGTRRLVELTGPSAALDLVATGRSVTAEEGTRLGLVDRMVAPEQLDAEVDGLVGALLATPPATLVAVKQLMSGVGGRTRDQQLLAERSAQVPLLRALVARSPSA